MATAELLFQLKGDPSNVKQILAQVRSELAQTQKSSEAANRSELSTRNQLAAAQSLQRQRSAALIAQWKQQETAARQAAAGTKPFGEVLQGLTQAITTMQGPLGGVASRVTSLTGLLSGLALGAGAVALAIGAMAAAAVGGAIAFFKLVQSVSETTGKLHDLSQQVGVSVETLSTLDTLASTTGGNIDTVTASLALFQRNLEDAHDPTSKESKLLRELGVTSLNTEVALRQTLRGLFALGEGAKQTDASIQLFGRSGRFINAILKESKGDLDAATERFQKMGLIIGGPAAAAADRFNDSLEILTRQLASVTRILTSDTIPVFIAFFEQLSGMLTGNKNDWQSWSRVVETSVAGVIATIQGAILAASTGQLFKAKQFTDLFFDSLIARSRQVRNEIFAQSEIERFGRITDQILGRAGRPGDRPDADTAKSQAQARANKALQLQQQALEESTRRHIQALERERDLDLKNIDEWEHESRVILTNHLTAQQSIFNQEELNINRFVQNEEDRLLALTELQQKRTKLLNDTLAAIQKVEDDANRRRTQSANRIEQQLFQIQEAKRQGELDIIKRALDQQAITEQEALTRQLEILKEAHAERLLLIETELKQLTTSAERKVELDNQKIESEQRFTNETKRLIEERNAAREKEIASQAPGARGIPEVSPFIDLSSLGEAPDAPINNLNQAFERLGQTISNTLGISAESGQRFANMLGGAIDDLAHGVGALVEQWVLLGETGPAAMRKMTALVLAGLARQAAIKAIYELAEGFAALFYNPAAAAAHFKAAALFASVAGLAAVAGRGIAGDSFKSPSGGGGSGGSGGGSPQPLNTIVGRNQPIVVRVTLPTIQVNPNSQFGPAITAHFADDFKNGGITRQVVHGDGR